jgi:hypothetical protein
MGSSGGVPMTTLDAATDALGLTRVALLKIDVEGAELDVLAGAGRVIARDRPVLCIEVHTARNLRGALSRLRAGGYCIVDCLGYSPTYVLVPAPAAGVRVDAVNALWTCRAALPERFGRARDVLAALARRLAPQDAG